MVDAVEVHCCVQWAGADTPAVGIEGIKSVSLYSRQLTKALMAECAVSHFLLCCHSRVSQWASPHNRWHGYCSQVHLLLCSLLQVTVENVIRVLTGKTSGVSPPIHSGFVESISLSSLCVSLSLSPPFSC